jgi:hypothetical protein
MTDLEIVFLASTAIFYLLWSNEIRKYNRLKFSLVEIAKKRARAVIDEDALTISIEPV